MGSYLDPKSKTFWGAVAGIIAAIGGFMTGDLTMFEAGGAALLAIQSLNIRHTVAKAK